MTQIALSNLGVLSVATVVGAALGLEYTTHSNLGAVSLDVAFFAQKTTGLTLNDIVMRLTYRDDSDVIYRVQGTLDDDIENPASILAVADAMEIFSNFDLTLGASALAAIQDSDAFNAANSLGRNVTTLTIVAEALPVFDAELLYQALTTLDDRPAYLVLPQLSDLTVYVATYRAAAKLNIPLDAEVDPTITVDQVVQLATTLDAQDHRVQLIWSPVVCRPRDAISLRGRKVPCYVLGQYLGNKLLRNARTSAQGIPKIADPVAGHDFPFTFKNMQMRDDVLLDEPTLERLAVAKVNVNRRIKFRTGVRFVLSDVLTQYQSKNSALRLVNSAEIACYTSNVVTDIVKQHMLKRTDSYLTDASREIDKFLGACSSSTVKLLVPATDLGGKPYSYSLKPDPTYPFERVRLTMARCPNGATRAVIFDDDILSK